MKTYIQIVLIFFLFISCSKDVEPEVIPNYDLKVSVTPVEGGAVTPSEGSYPNGTAISLLATPSPEYIFKEWTGGVTGTTNPISVTMSSNKNVSVVFEKRKYPLSIIIEGEGTVTEEVIQSKPTTDYPSGSVVKLTAVPVDGWEFESWSGDYVGTDNPINININSVKTINVVFNPKCTLEKISNDGFLKTSYELRFIYHHPDIYNILTSIDPNHGDHVTNYGSTSLSIDYNNDGYLDFISYYNDYGVENFRSYVKFFTSDCNGNLTFDENNSNKFLGLVHGRKLITGDYNNDSFPDILFIGHGWDHPPFTGEYSVILFGSENGLFIEKRLVEFVSNFHSGASGDIDNDGDLDIILTTGPEASVFLLNDGQGNFVDSKDIIYENNRGTSRYTTEIIDINKDGFEDIIIGGGENFDWKISDGIIDSPPIIYYGPDYNTNIEILPKFNLDCGEGSENNDNSYRIVNDFGFFDIDGDSKYEIIIYRVNGNYTGWCIQILTEVEGKYVDRTNQFIEDNYDINTFAWLYIGDFDQDGVIEMVSEWDEAIDWKYDRYEKWELQNKKFVKINN